MTQLLFVDFECPVDGSTIEVRFREQIQIDGYLVALRSDDEASNVSVEQVLCGTYVLLGARGLSTRALDEIPLKLACRAGDVIALQLRQNVPGGKRGRGRMLAIVHPAPPPPPSTFALELRAR